MPITIVNHPLVQHKLGLLREADISTYKFRTLTHELARLLAYEATRDFELEPVTIDGWCGDINAAHQGAKVTVVPILRAGLGHAGRRAGFGAVGQDQRGGLVPQRRNPGAGAVFRQICR